MQQGRSYDEFRGTDSGVLNQLNEHMNGFLKMIITTSSPAVIDPLNNAVEELNTDTSINLKPSSANWEQYDKYIMNVIPGGHVKHVKNESGEICGELELVRAVPYKCRAICQWHAGRCKRLRTLKTDAGETPQMLEQMLARWLIEGASHDSTAKHMASRHFKSNIGYAFLLSWQSFL